MVFASLVAAMAAANVCAWGLLNLESAWVTHGAVLAGVAAASATAARAWRRQTADPLSWDGSRWHWAGREGPWIAVSCATASGSWPAWRAALYSRRPADRIDAPPA